MDEFLAKKIQQVEDGSDEDFKLNSDDILSFCGRLYVLVDKGLRHAILTEAYSSPYAMHLCSIKMYQDLRELYW